MAPLAGGGGGHPVGHELALDADPDDHEATALGGEGVDDAREVAVVEAQPLAEALARGVAEEEAGDQQRSRGLRGGEAPEQPGEER